MRGKYVSWDRRIPFYHSDHIEAERIHHIHYQGTQLGQVAKQVAHIRGLGCKDHQFELVPSMSNNPTTDLYKCANLGCGTLIAAPGGWDPQRMIST